MRPARGAEAGAILGAMEPCPPGRTRIVTLPRLVGALLLAVGVAAVLVLSATLPSAQTAQPPVPLTPADQAAQALNTGRYDEVDGLLKGATDTRSTTLRARAAIARGRYADAEKLLAPAAAASPASDAALELGLLQQYLGRRQDARRTLQRVARRPRAAHRRRLHARPAAPPGRWASSRSPTTSTSAAATGWRPATWRSTPRGAICSSRSSIGPTRSSRIRTRSRPTRPTSPPASGWRAWPPRATRPRRRKRSKRRSRPIPTRCRRTCCSAELALDDRRRDDAEASIKKALEVNPNSLEAHCAAGRRRVRRQQAGRGRDARAGGAEDQPDLRRGLPHRRPTTRRAATCFDEAAAFVRKALITDPNNAQAYADLGMYLLRTGDEGEARVALERAFKDDPFNVSTFNSLDLLDTLAKFETITDGDLVFKFHPDEVAVMREQAIPLAKEALAALSKRYQFTPKGPLLIEMFPKHDDFAVRTIGLPGHDRRARRLLRPRRHARLAARAHARRVQLGRDAVARAGARDHAADVRQPRAAVADRGHLGVRGAPGAARVGQGVRRLVRAGAGRRQGHQARRAERGVQRPEDDLAGLLPGVARGRSSGADLRRAGAVEDAARLRPRARRPRPR